MKRPRGLLRKYWATLSRNLRPLWPWLERRLWIVPIAIWPISTLAFLLAPRDPWPSSLLLDSMLRALQLTVLSLDREAISPVPVFVLVMANLAGMVTVGAGIAFVARLALNRLRLWLQTWNGRERAVLFGFGTINRAVARHMAENDYAVTVVDKVFDDSARQLAAIHGLVLVAADLADPASLSPLRLDAAERVVVALGNDMANVELGTSLMRKNGPLVFMHVADVQLAGSLRQLGREGLSFLGGRGAAGAGPGWTFSLKEEAARNLMIKAQLALSARTMGQAKVHLVIVGFGDQGRAVLLETLLDATAAGLAPPRITVIDREADCLALRFAALHPRLMDSSIPDEARPTLVFLEADMGETDLAANRQLTALEDQVPITAYVFCCGDDSVNLDAGLRLEQAMRRGARHTVPIYLAHKGAGMLPDALRQENRLSILRTFGATYDSVASSPLLRNDPDGPAKLLNGAYNDQAVEQGLMPRPDQRIDDNSAWAGLAETLQESNRRAIRHARTKLLDLGLRWRGGTMAGLPSVPHDVTKFFHDVEAGLHYPGIIDDDDHGQAGSAEIDMARCVLAEHRRWLIDRAMDDWRQRRHGETRDNRQRIHSNIVRFADLSPENKRFDAMLIRALLTHCASLSPEMAPQAFPLNKVCAFIEADGALAQGVLGKATDVALAWSSNLSAVTAAQADDIVERLREWSLNPFATRLTIILGRTLNTRIGQSGMVSMAALVTRIDGAVDADVQLQVVSLHGRGNAGLSDTELKATMA